MATIQQMLNLHSAGDDLQTAATWTLVDRLNDAYANGEAFDTAIVFELANRALEAEMAANTAENPAKTTKIANEQAESAHFVDTF